MVTFLINEKVLEFNETDTILEVKKEIIKQLELTCKYIDLVFILEKPMRILGKFNVEPGKLARTLDRYVLEKFAFKFSSIEYVLSMLLPSTKIISRLPDICLNLFSAFFNSSLLPSSFLAGIHIETHGYL